MRFYGVPLSGFFFVPLAWFSPETASRLFKLQGFLALAISLGVLYWHARQFVTPTEAQRWNFAAWFATLAVAYQPFWTIYRVGGQTTPTVVLLLVAALLSYVEASDHRHVNSVDSGDLDQTRFRAWGSDSWRWRRACHSAAA